MSDNLRPCPFCGKAPEEAWCWVNLRDTNESKRVGWFCLDCFELPLDNCAVSHLESDKWNTRPLESALQSKLSIAVEALEKILKYDSPESIAKEALAKIKA